MFLVPKSEINIGKVRFYGEGSGVSSVEISQSVSELGGKAKIVIPRNFRRVNGKGVLDYIAVGDKVSIRLGYDDRMNDEFSGYVSEIGDDTPITISCDSEMYRLKHAGKMSKNFKQPLLTDVLDFLFGGLGIKTDSRFSCAQTLDGFLIKECTPYEALEKLRSDYGFYVRLKGDTSTCFWPYDFCGFATHHYYFGSLTEDGKAKLSAEKTMPNVVNDSLRFVRASDQDLYIEGISMQRNGTRLTVTAGDTTKSKRTFHFDNDLSKSELQQQAADKLKTWKHDGYSGDITGFGYPFTMPGDSLTITDPDNKERQGTYLIDEVTVSYSPEGGYRRKNKLSYRIS